MADFTPPKTKNYLVLKDFIAKGSHKQCYRHPYSDELCVKVPYNDLGKIDLEREISYLRQLYAVKDRIECLPRYFGAVPVCVSPTDRDLELKDCHTVGYVFEFVRNYDGSRCHTLLSYLIDEEKLRNSFGMLSKVILKLRSQMLTDKVFTMKLYSENILIQEYEKAKFRAVIINDMGISTAFKAHFKIGAVTRAHIERKWLSLVSNMMRNAANPIAVSFAAMFKGRDA